MEPGTTTPTTWAERHTETRSRRSSNNDDRLQPVLFLLKDPLRFIERAKHIRLFGIGELAAGGDPSGKLSHSNQRASDFAAAGVRVGAKSLARWLECESLPDGTPPAASSPIPKSRMCFARSMKRSGSLRRKRTGWSRSSSFDERRDLVSVCRSAHVVGVVVPRAIDHRELDRAAGGGCHVSAHRDRNQLVGGAVEDEQRAVNPPDSADVVELEPYEKAREDAVVLSGHPARAGEW